MSLWRCHIAQNAALDDRSEGPDPSTNWFYEGFKFEMQVFNQEGCSAGGGEGVALAALEY